MSGRNPSGRTPGRRCTGFRAAEVSSLTPSSFDLDADTPTITCSAGYTKNGKEARQPIHPTLAEALRPWLKGKQLGVPVCPLPEGKAGALLQADMKAARERWIDEGADEAERAARASSDFLRPVDAAGRVADFHALRVSYISAVVRGGASLKAAMELARHSDPKLTLRTYARMSLADLGDAVPALPGRDSDPTTQAARATGTDGKPSDGLSGICRVESAGTRSGARPGAANTLRLSDDREGSKFAFSAAGRSDLQRGAPSRTKCRGADSNRRPAGYESAALTS